MSKDSSKVIIRNSMSNVNTFSNSGSIYEKEYGYKYDDDGMKQLVLQGKKNVYEIIQSHKDDTNIYNIINRVLQGDYSLLDKNQGNDINTADLPKSINEYHEFIQKSHDMFNTLDPKIKSLFKNSFENFGHCIENGTLNQVLSQLKNDIDNKANDSVNQTQNVKVKESVENGK